MTGRQALNRWQATLHSNYDEREIRSIFLMWLEHVAGWSRMDWLTKCDEEWTIHDAEVLSRLSQGEPIQHILGQAPFMDHVYSVNSSVLIPRPETEDLIRWVLDSETALDCVLDIGSGSGCIAIELALAYPKAEIWSMDVSEAALTVAEHNSKSLNADVHWVQKDALQPWAFDQSFDMIISNPPYIKEEEKVEMADHVVRFEPHLALFVPDADPLLFYRNIAFQAKDALRKGGKLYFECHIEGVEAVVEMLKSQGYKEVEWKEDITGRNRFVRAVHS